ncbi:hypothetical protein NDU88_001642 [Pleurodeles waltl]|uniref:Uncharacterized protein n=1 Tax=Pleurodeles waltl TaxID=8319 RepID=A0AAV7UUM3_PLEWA|nr:hypothetical protein NDU88_001642 [Pleurodeles waltl]
MVAVATRAHLGLDQGAGDDSGPQKADRALPRGDDMMGRQLTGVFLTGATPPRDELAWRHIAALTDLPVQAHIGTALTDGHEETAGCQGNASQSPS